MAGLPGKVGVGLTAAALCAGGLAAVTVLTGGEGHTGGRVSADGSAAGRQGAGRAGRSATRDGADPTGTPRAGAGPDTGDAGAAAASSRRSVMQVIGHPDDDVLFMNPDVADDIRAGQDSTTIVVTAGEGRAGQNGDTHDPLTYVNERRTGLHAAYAAMAGRPDQWSVTPVKIGRVTVEIHTLAGRPGIRVAFLSLPDGRDKERGLDATARLYADTASRTCVKNFVPAGSVYAHCYTRTDVVATLAGLMRRYRTTLVRSQDSAPDKRYIADHSDHVASARFADLAARTYDGRIVLVHYRDYNTRESAENITGDVLAGKQRIFELYRVHDYHIDPATSAYPLWERRLRYRWPRGTTWAGRMPTGRVQAFAVLAGGLYTWWQTPSGWAGPARLGGGTLDPAITVLGGRVYAQRGTQIVAATPKYVKGRWKTTWTTVGSAAGIPAAAGSAVFARTSAGDVVVKCRTAKGAWPGKWTTLHRASGTDAPSEPVTEPGTEPSSGTGPLTAPVAAPVAEPVAESVAEPVTEPVAEPVAEPLSDTARPAGTTSVDTDGEVALVSATTTTDAGVADDVQDGLAAIKNGSTVELLVPTRTQVLHWRQEGTGCSFTYSGAIAGARPGSPLSVTYDAARRPSLLFHPDGSDAVRQLTETAPGDWTTVAPGKVVERLGEAPAPTGDTVPPALPVPMAGTVSVASDKAGNTVALALGMDGRMYVSRRASTGAYAAWKLIG